MTTMMMMMMMTVWVCVMSYLMTALLLYICRIFC